jgi:soluble lytic murein transglycosylase
MFPDSAGKALVQKASEYRWKVAQQKAKTKEYKGAWQWAETISVC